MKNRSKSVAIASPSLIAGQQLLQLMMTLLILLLATACNTQKDTTTTAQRPSTQQARGERPSIDEIFAMDANQDGKLDKSEIKGPLLRDFDRVDSDSDGFITRTELENAPRPPRGQGPRNNK